jgi:dihydrofolate synthase/folylpolyglutamate synthase
VANTPIDIIHRRGAMARGLVADRSSDTSVAARGHRRMGVLLDALGNPQLTYRTIHVAGSKGKGTTTHIVAALLTAAGFRTGRYVSPHLLRWNERIAVDDLAIPDSDFTRILTDVDRAMAMIEAEQLELGPFNAFELLTATAFRYFLEQRCDIAVIEVGLGGRFDSTNHLDPSATIITRIEEEHLDILGPRLVDVAWNKAGVIKSRVPVVSVTQRADVAAVIETEARAAGAPLLRQGRDWSALIEDETIRLQAGDGPPLEFRCSLPGTHNLANIGAAVVAALIAIGDRSLPESVVSGTMATIQIPGRFDRRVDPATGRTLVLDGAHTPESIRALVETAVAELGSAQFPVILGVLADKPAIAILTLLAPVTSRIICPEQRNPRAISGPDLCAAARDLGLDAAAMLTMRAALDAIGAGPEPILVTGSFGVVADALTTLAGPARFDV